MTRLVLEFEYLGGEPLVSEGEPPEPPTYVDRQISRLAGDWATHVLEPFQRHRRLAKWLPTPLPHLSAREPRSLDDLPESAVLTVTFPVGEESVQVTLRLGAELLEDLLSTYVLWGWEAVMAADRAVPRTDVTALAFVRATQLTAYHIVQRGLAGVESAAVGYAAQSWRAARETLEGYQTRLARDARSVDPLWHFKDRDMGERLVALCQKYAKLQHQATRLGEKVAGRRKGAYTQRGTGWQLWFEVYAAPQRDVLAKMETTLQQIVAEFPAAALVLGELPPEVSDPRARESRWGDVEVDPYGDGITTSVPPRIVANRLAGKIHDTVQALLDELEALLATLAAPLPRGEPTGTPGAMEGSRYILESGGIERLTLDTVLDRQGSQQRVLVNPHLLAELADPEGPLRPASWEAAVLSQYRRRLGAVIAADHARHTERERYWSYLNRVVAGVALVSLLAIFPFGGAGVAPALAAILVVAGSMSTGLTVIMLVVHQVLGQLQLAGTLEKEARERLFALAQQDPTALRDIGDLIAESAAVRRGLGEGLLTLLLELGLSRFRLIAAALDLLDQVDNVESLFGPAPVAA